MWFEEGTYGEGTYEGTYGVLKYLGDLKKVLKWCYEWRDKYYEWTNKYYHCINECCEWEKSAISHQASNTIT